MASNPQLLIPRSRKRAADYHARYDRRRDHGWPHRCASRPPARPQRRVHAVRPSRTALAAAVYRAEHQVPERGRVFGDPLALRILGQDAGRVARDAGADPVRRHMRLFIALRGPTRGVRRTCSSKCRRRRHGNAVRAARAPTAVGGPTATDLGASRRRPLAARGSAARQLRREFRDALAGVEAWQWREGSERALLTRPAAEARSDPLPCAAPAPSRWSDSRRRCHTALDGGSDC